MLVYVRALKCHALSVTVTHFGLQSRTPATHRISHAEKNSRLFNVPQRANMTWPRCPHHEGIKHVSPTHQEFCRELPLISQSKKRNGLQNSQSEKTYLLYLGKISSINQSIRR